MANKYSKGNFVNKDTETKPKNSMSDDMKRYEERQKRLSTTAKVLAILVALAMIISAFLTSGLFALN